MDIQHIRQLLSQGDTGKALMALIALLEKDSRYKDSVLRTLRVAEANFNAIRQQELKGLLNFQEAQREYSRANDLLVSVLDDIEAGRVPPAAAPAARRNRFVLLAGAVALLGAAVFGVWKLRDQTAGCPTFTDQTALHILILPFDQLGDINDRPELVIQSNILELTKKAEIPAEVKPNTLIAAKSNFSGEADSRVATAETVALPAAVDSLVPPQYDGKNRLVKIARPESEWKKILSEQEYYVLRKEGTERAFSGDLWKNHAKGTYICRGCGLPLFSSATKFESGTGWPSFWQPLKPEYVKENSDSSYGMVRIEVECARCGGHLGHVFDDGPKPTNLRYCMNSVSLDFVPE